MVKYTLNYFPTSGRAEAARLMFKCAGVEFTDNIIPPTEWPQAKSDTIRFPLNQLPTLQVDDIVICQSAAIYRYLSNELGYYGDNNAEKAIIDQVCETFRDIIPKFTEILFNKDLSDEDKGKKAATLLEDDHVKKCFNFVLSFLKKNNEGKGFFVGNKISLADFFLHSIDIMLTKISPSYKDAYPEFKGLVDRINAIEAVKNHNAQKKY